MTFVLRSLRCAVCHLIAIIILIPLKLDNWSIPMRTIFGTFFCCCFFFVLHMCSVPCAQSMAHAINSSRINITYHKYLSIYLQVDVVQSAFIHRDFENGCVMRVFFRGQRRLVSQLENMRMRWWKSLQSIREQTCDHEFGPFFCFFLFHFRRCKRWQPRKNRI